MTSALHSPAASPPPQTTTVEEAYEYCRSITHRFGANFSVGFRFLPPHKERAVYAAYAFCRWADDIADDPGENIGERLDGWEEELERCYDGSPTHPITVALADALQQFPIPKQAFAALIEGCRQDLVKIRYQTFEELLHYCDLVATSISDISLAIFGYSTGKATEYGRNLSTALQLTNVTRDVGDDLERDRIYLPLEELEQFGVSEEDLAARRESENMRRLMLFQTARAREYFRRAAPLLDELERDSRFPTLLMGSVYSEVLRKIEGAPLTPLHRRVSLSKGRKLYVILRGLIRRRFV